jgi:hypothetical protein
MLCLKSRIKSQSLFVLGYSGNSLLFIFFLASTMTSRSNDYFVTNIPLDGVNQLKSVGAICGCRCKTCPGKRNLFTLTSKKS